MLDPVVTHSEPGSPMSNNEANDLGCTQSAEQLTPALYAHLLNTVHILLCMCEQCTEVVIPDMCAFGIVGLFDCISGKRLHPSSHLVAKYERKSSHGWPEYSNSLP